MPGPTDPGPPRPCASGLVPVPRLASPKRFAHALVELLVGSAPVDAPERLAVFVVQREALTLRHPFGVLPHPLPEVRVVHEAVRQLLHGFLVAHLTPPPFSYRRTLTSKVAEPRVPCTIKCVTPIPNFRELGIRRTA